MVGIHLVPPLAAPDPATFDDLTAGERAALDDLARSERWESGYAAQQATRPQTLGYGLADSPVGQCAWIVEKLRAWSDNDGLPENAIPRDRILDLVTLYWLTGTATSSARLYRESFATVQGWFTDAVPDVVDVPTGCSIFPKEMPRPSRRWAERRFPDIRHWHELDRGGHFAALEQPALFVDELRTLLPPGALSRRSRAAAPSAQRRLDAGLHRLAQGPPPLGEPALGRRGPAQHPQRHPPDVLERAGAHRPQPVVVVVDELVAQRRPHHDRPREGDGGDAAGQVDHRAVEVALALEQRAVRHADPHVRQLVGPAGALGQRQPDLGRGHRRVDREHDLVADHLHDPPAVGGDDVERELLELVDDRRQLVVADLLAERGEPDQVGEARPRRAGPAPPRRSTAAAGSPPAGAGATSP